jgi:hypothetical protein
MSKLLNWLDETGIKIIEISLLIPVPATTE